MKLIFKNANPPAKLEDIQNYQKKYNIDLPQDYINFLLENDGADCIDNMFYKKETEYWGNVQVTEFLNIKELNSWAEDFYNEKGYYPIRECKKNGAIIIGTLNPSEISMGIEKNNFGQIFVSSLISNLEMEKIADSFTEFINGFEYEENL